jgi:uncharacterized membrane protein (Fun14 family)
MGLPTIAVMIVSLILGLVVGFLFKKFLKFAIIAIIILAVVSYLGFFGLSLTSLKNLVDTYGPIAVQYGTLIIGMLPLSIGFIVGIIVGFVFT